MTSSPIRALAHVPGGASGALDAVTLDYEARWRRRGLLHTESGQAVLLDLPEAVQLDDGDALTLEDGGRIAVRAADEALVEVRGESPRHLARLAWHLGNRHLPVEIGDGKLLIRRDHVLEDMLRKLGALMTLVEGPFRPEGGAYGHGRTHGHSHSHDPHEDPDAALRDQTHG